MVFENPRFALAPAGFLHLEQAVYRLARHVDPALWQERLADTRLYERLGVSLHLFHLGKEIDALWGTSDLRIKFDARWKSCFAAESLLRSMLRKGHVSAVLQSQRDGHTFPCLAEWWAQELANRWFNEGDFLADIFVDEASFNRALLPTYPESNKQRAPRQELDDTPAERRLTPEQERRALIAHAKEILARQFALTSKKLSEAGDQKLLKEHGVAIPREELREVRHNIYPEIRRGAPRKDNLPSKSPENKSPPHGELDGDFSTLKHPSVPGRTGPRCKWDGQCLPNSTWTHEPPPSAQGCRHHT